MLKQNGKFHKYSTGFTVKDPNPSDNPNALKELTIISIEPQIVDVDDSAVAFPVNIYLCRVTLKKTSFFTIKATENLIDSFIQHSKRQHLDDDLFTL